MNNQITVIGHVGQAPTEVSFADTGNKVAKFPVAVKEYSSNSEETKTMWIDVDAWNGLADRVLATITKGREVALVGRLAIAQYTKEVDGVTVQVSKPVIKLTSFHLCGRRPESNESADVSDAPKPRAGGRAKRLKAVNA